MQNTQIFTRQSKRLAYLLRHSTLPDSNGWVSVAELVQKHQFNEQELKEIVAKDEKGRFESSEDNLSIRALYGHSIKVTQDTPSKKPPEYLYHGTATKYLESIMDKGILPKSRNYVHLSETLDGAIQVGERHGVPYILTISAGDMYRDGHLFYNAQTGVWLTKKVPVKYISTSAQ